MKRGVSNPLKGTPDVPVGEIKFRDLDNIAKAEMRKGLKTVKVVFTDGSSQSFGDVVRVYDAAANSFIFLVCRRLARPDFADSPLIETLVDIQRTEIRWIAIVEEVAGDPRQ